MSELPEPATVEAGLWEDLLPLLDRELSRLPDKLRQPIVLCDLEGQTRKEAARQLGWPEGTVAGRLAQGRALLASRLRRHGLAVSSGVLAALLPGRVSAAVPPALVTEALQTAWQGPADGAAAAIARGVLGGMALGRSRTLAAFLLLVALKFHSTSESATDRLVLHRERPAKGSAAAADDGAGAEKELSRLRGVWELTLLESRGRRGGRPLAGRPAWNDKVLPVLLYPHYVFRGDKFAAVGEDGAERCRGTIRVDPAANAIDLAITGGDGKGKTLAGPYELTGNTMRVAFDQHGTKRPAGLKAEWSSTTDLWTFRRSSSPDAIRLTEGAHSVLCSLAQGNGDRHMLFPCNRCWLGTVGLLAVFRFPARPASAGERQDEAPRPAVARAGLTDRFGDPLPPGAVARLGTMRWRTADSASVLAFSATASACCPRSATASACGRCRPGRKSASAPSPTSSVPPSRTTASTSCAASPGRSRCWTPATASSSGATRSTTA